MKNLSSKIYKKKNRVIKCLQFGEGNFLRAFVDRMLSDINKQTDFNGGVCVVQPLAGGRVAELEKQDGLYTLITGGVSNNTLINNTEIIDVLDDFINPYTQYDKYLDYAKNEDIQFIISNTTEAGIALDTNDLDFSITPKSFPSKLLAFLKARYDCFDGNYDSGLYIIACELIDNNGDTLKEVLLKLSMLKEYDENFVSWLLHANHYYNTLVDQIVPGYPNNEINEIQNDLGYIDNNLIKCEAFYLWVISGNPSIKEVLPFDKTDLNILFVDDIQPYKERKVKILNGSHTCMVPLAYQSDLCYVHEVMTDEILFPFINQFIDTEVLATINLPKEEIISFKNSVFDRFRNPFIQHELLSISLNSMSKYKQRVLPSAIAYYEKTGLLPRHALFSFAALFHMYALKKEDETSLIKDDPELLSFWSALYAKNLTPQELTKQALELPYWNYDFNTMKESHAFIETCYIQIQEKGIKEAIQSLFSETYE